MAESPVTAISGDIRARSLIAIIALIFLGGQESGILSNAGTSI